MCLILQELSILEHAAAVLLERFQPSQVHLVTLKLLVFCHNNYVVKLGGR